LDEIRELHNAAGRSKSVVQKTKRFESASQGAVAESKLSGKALFSRIS
jgi:hypothetical protein